MSSHAMECLVCGDVVKANHLCNKHHQRYRRTGSVYLKNEEVGKNNIDQMLIKLNTKVKVNLGLAKHFF